MAKSPDETSTTPPVAELQRLGVRRLSLGPKPLRKLLAELGRMGRELLDRGTYSRMTQESPLTYAEVNAWFERQAANPSEPEP